MVEWLGEDYARQSVIVKLDANEVESLRYYLEAVGVLREGEYMDADWAFNLLRLVGAALNDIRLVGLFALVGQDTYMYTLSLEGRDDIRAAAALLVDVLKQAANGATEEAV